MLALMLADRLFALRERTLLSRLAIALLDEGVHVVHAVPDRACPDDAGPGVVAQRVTYTPSALSFMRAFQSRRLLRDIDAIDQLDNTTVPEVVHVFGGSAWNLGRRVAMDCGAALVLEVWRAGLARRAISTVAGLRTPAALIAPDPLIERELRRLNPRANIVAAPWGALLDEMRVILPEHRAASIMVVGGGYDPSSFHAAFAGLAAVLRTHRDVLVFCDADAARRAELWQTARSLGLLDRLSLVEDLEARRELVLRGDILVLPEARGEQRSVTVEAMAHGMCVIAARDSLSSILVEDRTARLVPAHDAGLWERAFTDALDHPDHARQLGLSAQSFVREHRRASAHARLIASAYLAAISKPAEPVRSVV